MQPVTQKKVLVQPEGVAAIDFAKLNKSPQEVLSDPKLTREEKEKLLKAMEFDVRSRLDALSEGMLSHPPEHASKDAGFLEEIAHALKSLSKVGRFHA